MSFKNIYLLFFVLITTASARQVKRDDDPTITDAPSLLTVDTTAQYTFTNFSGQSNTPNNFNGWYIESNSLSPVACRGSNSWITSGFYGTCCPALSQCEPATACVDNTVTYPGKTIACSEYDEEATCFSLTVFETYPTGSPKLNYYCESTNYEPHTLFRTFTKPSTTTTETTETTSTIATPATSSSVSEPTSGGVDSMETSTTTHTPMSNPDPPQSNAWVAGAVIGPVAGVCFGIFVFWYLRRRAVKGKNIDGSSQETGQGQEYYRPQPPEKGTTPLPGYERTADTTPRELVGSRPALRELEGSEPSPTELPAEDVPSRPRT